MNTKAWYTSKTLWMNLIAMIAMIVQAEFGFIIDPDLQAYILGIINLLLRLFTKTSLDWSNLPKPPTETGGAATALLLIGLLTVAGCTGTGAGLKPAPSNDGAVIIAGKSLLAAKSTIVTAASATDALCRAEKISSDTCAQAKLAYKTSQHAYDAAVDAYLLMTVQGGDPAQFTQALIRVQDIANHLLTLAGE